MKSKTNSPKADPVSSAALLGKRQEIIARYEHHQSEAKKAQGDLAALDLVMSMFDPGHVGLDVRSGAKVITGESKVQPLLSDGSGNKDVVSEIRKRAKAVTPKSGASKKTVGTPQVDAAVGKQVEPAAQEAPTAMAVAISRKARQSGEAKRGRVTKEPAQSQKDRTRESREFFLEYFKNVDKLGTLEAIVRGAPEGIAFSKVLDAFRAKHEVDISDPIRKNMFSQRISSILNQLMTAGKVRHEPAGDGGKGVLWFHGQGAEGARRTEPMQAAA